MKLIIYASLIAVLSACQSKKETTDTQLKTNADTVATAPTQPQNTSDEILTFGFSNENGTKILAFEEGITGKSINKVIDNQGNVSDVTFESSQKGSESGVNLVSTNFKNCAGHVMSLPNNKKVSTDQSVVLFNDAFLNTRQPVIVKSLPTPKSIDSANKIKIEAEHKRKIKEGWKIADVGSESAFIVIFEKKQDSVLASLVMGGKTYIFKDYPAKYDEGSTWRVDDGGQFPNDAIKIIGAFMNSKNELEIIIDWAGAEGANIEYAKANKNKFETIKEASRYWGAM